MRCYFQPTVVTAAAVHGVVFELCEFEELSISQADALAGTQFVNCIFRSVIPPHREDAIYVPAQILMILQRAGANVSMPETMIPEEPIVPDEELSATRRILRTFTRVTELNERTIQMKLGVYANYFISDVLPKLLRESIVREIPYQGRGSQHRFRLNAPLRVVEKNIEQSRGSFEAFIQASAMTEN